MPASGAGTRRSMKCCSDNCLWCIVAIRLRNCFIPLSANSFFKTFRCITAGEGTMKKIFFCTFVLLLSSCKENPSQPQPQLSQIIAYVHWENQALAGKQVQLLQTGETKLTDANGMAEFSVASGNYVVRAFGIDAPGPSPRTIDYTVEVGPGQKSTVDIFDCLPCM